MKGGYLMLRGANTTMNYVLDELMSANFIIIYSLLYTLWINIMLILDRMHSFFKRFRTE